MTKTFQIKIDQGDAIIRLKSNRMVQLIFAEDEETIVVEKEWHEQEVYRAAVQFALMIDTYLKNGEGLDSLIMHSPTGSIVAELLGKDMLESICLAGSEEEEEEEEEEEFLDRLEEVEEDLKDNIVDASNRFTKKEGKNGDK